MDSAFLTGQFLIAMPGIGDARFERALILVCAHDAEHAMGVAVNRTLDGLSVADLLERLEIEGARNMPDQPVLMGGPVETERGFVLHTNDYHAEHTVAVPGGLALTTTREVLVEMAAGTGTPRRALLALGYAGWGPGQLEREIRQNVWLTVEADEGLVFGGDHETRWARALAKLGVDPTFLSSEAGQA